MSALTMTPPVFSILTDLVEERAGLHYGLSDQSIFESKVSTRALEHGFDSALDYYYLLRYDDPEGHELTRLVEALVVHETYFFREYEQLEVLLTHFVAPVVAAGGRPRIWSAACATGEEPYTIAMWLDAHGLLDAVDILASDISQPALEVAQRARYRHRSLRRSPSGIDPKRWLVEADGTVTVDERLRAAVQWRQLNLLDADAQRSLGQLDVIVCRNVLMYFRSHLIERVVDQLVERLKPSGALLVGVSESLLRFSTRVRCEERDGAFLYRRVR
ncbi:MAG: protein-glutamate O-methyltransferase CheR [Polyangiales bacterium]